MQNIMFLLSTVTKVMSTLSNIQERMPYTLLEKMSEGKRVMSDAERMSTQVSMAERLSLGALENYVGCSDSCVTERYVQVCKARSMFSES